jgi:protein phosphatase PTC7
MRPYLQRIAAASLLLRSSKPLWTHATYFKPAITQHLPYYFQQQHLIEPVVTRRQFTSSRSVFLRDSTSTDPTGVASTTAAAPVSDEEANIASEKFQFIAYAAWHPKTRQKTPPTKKVPYWKENQKAGKVDAGEDAFFQTNTPEGLAIGVADGVGGWSLVGVDPALFSWTLMDNAAIVAKNEKAINAHQILDSAFHELRKSGKVAAGSSTACILNLSKTTGEMTSCNLGDSAFLLVRDRKIVYESPSQQHYFNCP